ncbi:MAG: protein-tyrosine-phosphatase [Planctomycetes bacterium]|nr:protein-tyrosine-phosphatase [Planctomycetota bacterium]
MMNARLADYVAARLAETDAIAPERRAALDALAADLLRRLAERGSLDLVFVCTHNSRRSQLGQVWASVAAEHFGFAGVRAWSGGTEATAFEPRAVAALERAGFVVSTIAASGAPRGNPVWLVRTAPSAEPLRCWSKVFSDAANPQRDFVAVMVCSAADADCPVVPGAALRVSLTYDDPKAFDGKPGESAAYDARCAQIARELLHLFRRMRELA